MSVEVVLKCAINIKQSNFSEKKRSTMCLNIHDIESLT